jgi:hypothetical protein
VVAQLHARSVQLRASFSFTVRWGQVWGVVGFANLLHFSRNGLYAVLLLHNRSMASIVRSTKRERNIIKQEKRAW